MASDRLNRALDAGFHSDFHGNGNKRTDRGQTRKRIEEGKRLALGHCVAVLLQHCLWVLWTALALRGNSEKRNSRVGSYCHVNVS